MNFVNNQAAADSFDECGILYYEFIAVLDNRTSKMCQSRDGEVYPMSEKTVGFDFPPLHPRCRSTVAPYIEDSGRLGSRIARVNGRRLFVPESMRYEEFKTKYLANDQKSVKINEGNIKANLETRFKRANFKFEALSYPPKEIDISKLRLDESHIKAREHGIDETTAKGYIKKALFSISRWNGKFEQYYSYEGAAYVLENSLIRTAFSAKEYDDKLQRILEICKEEIR